MYRLLGLALVLAAALAACVDEVVDPRSGQVDFRDPKSVIGSVFYAAETGETAHLAGLCDPTGAGDEDTRRICAMRPDAPDWDSFRRAFSRGRLNGEPRVHGDRARIAFLFGPDGRDGETMELVRRGGRWYLSSF
jgi:hypothetical protein